MRYLFSEVIDKKIKIQPVDSHMLEKIQDSWDKVSKPINGFGVFESLYSKVGAIQKKDVPDLEHGRLIVCCGDHGVVEEGVSQTDQSVTRICAENIGKGLTTAGVMARSLGIDVCAVDVGINCDHAVPGTINKKIRKGTANFLKEAAMTREECNLAIQLGMDLVQESKEAGYTILLLGEMGIGNTTSAAVMAGYLLDMDAVKVTGRGAGLDDKGLSKKVQVVNKALAMYEDLTAFEVMQYFGGLELAAMTGIVIGGALQGVPIVLDGMLSMIAALVADRIAPGVRDYLIPSHKSNEPVTNALGIELGIQPVIDGHMALGEGTGAVMMMSLLKMADTAYNKALKFGDSGVEQYKRF